MADNNNQKRDLLIPSYKYVHIVDGTKGVTRVLTGPTQITPSTSDRPTKYVEGKGFVEVESFDAALTNHPKIGEGSYAILRNPAKNRKHPESGTTANEVELENGRSIVIPGPAEFSLWPGEVCEVIPGHRLKTNQYLLVEVYNEEEARRNWAQAVMKPAESTPGGTPPNPEVVAPKRAAPSDLAIGKQYIIKGTEVSFYIPPTGVVVKKDDAGEYVREALTLEALEYAILKAESGVKEYVQGPTVVFPTPTQTFMTASNDRGEPTKKFRAVELNELQGIHLVAIESTEFGGKTYEKGEEIFLTGKDTRIFYPQEDLAVVKYDGKSKHFATSVPEGEARYVLDRKSSIIKLIKGAVMLLPDPRNEVIVRRVLSQRQCARWYPGNLEAAAHNQSLEEVLKTLPTTRSQPSGGDVARNYKQTKGGPLVSNVMDANYMVATGGGTAGLGGGLYATSNAVMGDSSRLSGEQNLVGEEFIRGSTYTQPRTLTLNTKYQGVPTIKVWTGYAVLVVSEDANGNIKRRVERGPVTVFPEYNEDFEVLTLSTGRPKNMDRPLETIFLRVENNQVSDLVTVETADHIQVSLKLGYRVNFEGDPLKWWSVENYVKFLCDELRSLLKGQIKKLGIAEFYNNATDLVRGVALGADPKKGRSFEANGMRLTDVEVLEVTILNPKIREFLERSQLNAVESALSLEELRRGLETTVQKEAIVQKEVVVRAETVKVKMTTAIATAEAELSFALAKFANRMKELDEQKKVDALQEQLTDAEHQGRLGREKLTSEHFLEQNQKKQELALVALKAEAEAVATRFVAAKDGLSEIAKVAANTDAAVRIAEALNMQRSIGGESFSDAASKVLGSIPALAPLFQKVVSTTVPPNGGHDKLLAKPAGA